MRYKNNKIQKDRNNVRYYKPTIVPNIPLQKLRIPTEIEPILEAVTKSNL